MSGTQCSNGMLRKATRRLGRLFDDVLEPSGLKATQHHLLTVITQMDRPTMRDLADTMVMDVSALGHTLKPLARDGYLVLTPDPDDRRCKRVRLTARGAEKLDETTRLWRLAQARFDAAFGSRKAEKLRKTLNMLSSEAFIDAFNTSTKLRRSSL